MARSIRRFAEFDVSVTIRDDSFIRTPREGQRQWVVNRAVGELVDELRHLDRRAPEFIPGGSALPMDAESRQSLTPDQTMEDWQVPVMRVMAEFAAASHGDVLEIGFGRGVSAGFIQELGVRSHTIVECNPIVQAALESWANERPDRVIRPLAGRWEDVVDGTGPYDAVFFHAYPLSPEEHEERVVRSPTFAAHFFPTAARLLRPGGVFTYFSNESDSLGRAHQRVLLEHFSEFTLRPIRPLEIPPDSRDAIWLPAMVVVRAVR